MISMKVYYDKILQIWEIYKNIDKDWASLFLSKNYWACWTRMEIRCSFYVETSRDSKAFVCPPWLVFGITQKK